MTQNSPIFVPLRSSLALCMAVFMLLAGPLAAAKSPQDMPYVSGEDLRQGVSLRGQWQFHPGDNLDWAAVSLNETGWVGKAMPGRWDKDNFHASNPMAWYRLTLQLDPQLLACDQLSQLSVRMGKVLSAYELYAGGELVGGVGI